MHELQPASVALVDQVSARLRDVLEQHDIDRTHPEVQATIAALAEALHQLVVENTDWAYPKLLAAVYSLLRL
jgi:hypothetical protein